MKNKKFNQQQLSPKNYIRQRAKNLPIYKCYVTSNWQKEKLCNIFIARKHVTGNITFCGYLVDLSCLGVKDTVYKFNITLVEFEKIIERYQQSLCLIEISYELAHNIIYAGLEYAEKFGFEPHEDFLSITSCFLEEDTEDIPFIEIECGGPEGKPLYINTGLDSYKREKEIIEQLSKNAGENNFNYIVDASISDNEDDDDEFEDDDDEFEDNDYEEYYDYDEDDDEFEDDDEDYEDEDDYDDYEECEEYEKYEECDECEECEEEN